MKGYRKLQRMGKSSLIGEIKQHVSKQHIPKVYFGRFPSFLNKFDLDKELVLRQYLVRRTMGLCFNASILSFFGAGRQFVVAPPHVANILHDNNVLSSKFFALVFWHIYIFAIWLHGQTMLIKLCIQTFPSLNQREARIHNSVFFYGLTANNLPRNSNASSGSDIISWYITQKKNGDVHNVFHSVSAVQKKQKCGDVNVVYLRHEMAVPLTSITWLKFLCWGCGTALYTLIDLLRGRWGAAFLSAEIYKAKLADLIPRHLHLSECWFPQTGGMYRPLWTYIATTKGTKIVLYFYSLNNNAIQPSADKQIDLGFWHLASWPIYLVWTDYQREWIEARAKKKAEFEVIGSLPFSDGGVRLPNIKLKSVAVFDVQPFRPFKHATMAQIFEYYNAKNCLQFLIDINQIAQNNGFHLYVKNKRNIGKIAHPKYVKGFKELENSSDVFIPIDPDASAHDLIGRVNVVVSLPFTSTALIARDQRKPTCYYDPLGIIDGYDDRANGVRVIGSKDALENWISQHIEL